MWTTGLPGGVISAHASSNLAKHQTTNPVVRGLLDRYFGVLRGIVAGLLPGSILDVGCGEGVTAARLLDLGVDAYAGVDWSEGAIAYARTHVSGATFEVGDVYSLDREADVVLCLEVLEHLDDPARAVAALRRCAWRAVVVSVPWEPWFRLGNLARGKHVRALGNHPGHVHQLAPSSLRRLLAPTLGDVEVCTSIPWVFAWKRLD